MIDPPQIALESLRIIRRLSSSRHYTCVLHTPGDARGDLRHRFIEHIQQILEGTDDLVAPNYRARLGLGKCEANSDGLPNLSNLSLQHVSDAKRIADADWIRIRLRQREGCAAREALKAPEAAEFDDQLIGQALGEEALVFIRA